MRVSCKSHSLYSKWLSRALCYPWWHRENNVPSGTNSCFMHSEWILNWRKIFHYSIVYYNRFRTLSYKKKKKKKKKTGCIYTKSKGEICCFIYYWMPSNGSCKLPTDLTKDFFLFSTGEDWEEINLVLIVKIVKGTRKDEKRITKNLLYKEEGQ